AVVFATGFDALTGPILAIHIAGRDGKSLREAWAAGPLTNLGLQTAGFPNLLLISGPGCPSTIAYVVKAVEQHVRWIGDLPLHARERGVTVIETTQEPRAQWVAHVNEVANGTLIPTGNSWYLGANVPGKPRVFLPYAGGIPHYRSVIGDVAAKGYE